MPVYIFKHHCILDKTLVGAEIFSTSDTNGVRSNLLPFRLILEHINRFKL